MRCDQAQVTAYLRKHSDKVKQATLDVAIAYWLMGQTEGEIAALNNLTLNAVRHSIKRMRRRVRNASRKHLRT